MPNYQNGKIYMITADNADEGDVYIGSTVYKLCQRFAKHKNARDKIKGVTSSILFNKYGVENCYIKLIKDYPCNDKKELCDEEARYIKETKCINHYIPNRTNKEYVIDNSQRLQEYRKQYRANNLEKIKKTQKECYEKKREYYKEKAKNIYEASKVKGQSV